MSYRRALLLAIALVAALLGLFMTPGSAAALAAGLAYTPA